MEFKQEWQRDEDRQLRILALVEVGFCCFIAGFLAAVVSIAWVQGWL